MVRNQPLEFYDLKTGVKFLSSDYELFVTAKEMLAARARAPSGILSIKLIRRA